MRHGKYELSHGLQKGLKFRVLGKKEISGKGAPHPFNLNFFDNFGNSKFLHTALT